MTRMYRVSEVQKMLGVSHTTIHKKLRMFKKEMKEMVIKERNTTLISDEGVEFLKSRIYTETGNPEIYLQSIDSGGIFRDELIVSLKQNLEHAKEELSKKDKIIEELLAFLGENAREHVQSSDCKSKKSKSRGTKKQQTDEQKGSKGVMT